MKILFLTLPLLISACGLRLHETQHFIHKPTYKIQKALSPSIRNRRVIGHKGREYIFVPDFSTYSIDHTNRRAELYIVSKRDTLIKIKKAVVINKDTGGSETIEYSPDFSPRKPVSDKNYTVCLVPILDGTHKSFSRGSELSLTVTYSVNGAELKTETMTIELVHGKDIVWPT